MKTAKQILITGAVLFLSMAAVIPHRADSCAVFWNWIDPAPSGAQLSAIAYGAGRYVAVGPGGLIVTSEDGISWTQRKAGTYNDFTSVAYGASRFVATGPGLFTSEDGITWTLASYAGPQVAFCGSLFFGDKGRYVSGDGVHWRPALYVTDTGRSPIGVAFGNGVYVCAVEDGTVYTSPDGLAWTQRYSPVADATGIAFGNGTFLIIGYESSASITATSRNGTSWTVTRPAGGNFTGGILFGNGHFVVKAYGGVQTSTDGRSWTYISDANYPSISQAIFEGGQFVGAGGSVYYGSHIFTSPDGLVWEGRGAYPLGLRSNRVRYLPSAGRFIVVGSREDGPPVAYSSDGHTWQDASSGPPDSLWGAAFGASTYVAVGDWGKVSTSADLAHWTSQASGISDALYDVAYGGGQFVAVGDKGVIATSPDGATWTRRASYVAAALRSVIYTDGLFVAAGAAITTSPDGVNWTQRWPAGGGCCTDIREVTYADGWFLAVTAGSLLKSRDGIQWQEQAVPVLLSGGILKWHDTFMAPAYTGGVALSEDLDEWLQDQEGLNQHELYGMASDGETLVGLGFIKQIWWGQCAPFAGRLSESYGPDTGGTALEIPGVGLRSVERVTFGGNLSPSVTVGAGGRLDVVSPPSEPGPQAVRIYTAEGECSPDFFPTFFYDGQAIVEGISPVKASTSGRSYSLIWGSGLINGSPPIDVTVGGIDTSAEAGWRTIKIGCPPRPAGPADVVLTTLSGFQTVLPGAVLYVGPPVITSVKIALNPTRLVIKGSNLRSDFDVRINGRSVPGVAYKKPTKVLATGGEALNAMIPSFGTCPVTVVNRDEGIISEPFQFQR